MRFCNVIQFNGVHLLYQVGFCIVSQGISRGDEYCHFRANLTNNLSLCCYILMCIYCYDTVLYDTVLYDNVLYVMISCSFVCLFILRDINYYYSCSIYAATLYVECGLTYCMPACAPGLRVPCKAVINQTTAKILHARVIWNRLAERCLKSYCSVVSLFCFDALWNFSASLPRNETLLFNVGRLLWTYRIDVVVVAHRWISSRYTSADKLRIPRPAAYSAAE